MSVEVHFESQIVSFDGRVVELFSPRMSSRGERYHVRHIKSFGIQDKKWVGRQLELANHQGGGWGIPLPDPMPEGVELLISSVQAAVTGPIE